MKGERAWKKKVKGKKKEKDKLSVKERLEKEERTQLEKIKEGMKEKKKRMNEWMSDMENNRNSKF